MKKELQPWELALERQIEEDTAGAKLVALLCCVLAVVGVAVMVLR